MAREPLSVVLITYNEVARIADCLHALDFADEILMVDSGSDDGTVEIARERGVRVIHHEWQGFGKQKQFAVAQADHDWVLCVDADERVSKILRDSILHVLDEPQASAYRMARRNRFMGRWLRYGEGYPDYVIRLFNRKNARWSEDVVHETVITQRLPGTVEGDLLHESELGVFDYAIKQVHYAKMQSEKWRQEARHSSTFRAVASPLVRFVKFYFFRRGFLDGLPGLAHILLGCLASFLKHLELIRLPVRSKSEDEG